MLFGWYTQERHLVLRDNIRIAFLLMDKICIAFLVAALNDLNVLSANISGAYLNTKNAAEKVYTIAGKEFGPEREGRVVAITRALNGLQSSGTAWRDHMAPTLRDHGYTSCKADPDV